jgi:hypothetical protein
MLVMSSGMGQTAYATYQTFQAVAILADQPKYQPFGSF